MLLSSLGLASGQRAALRDEYKMYHQLKSKGITTPLGLFEDVDGGACILVMPYVGASLATTPELVSISYRCIFILYPHFLTSKLGQGSGSCNFGGNTWCRHTARRS